MSYKNECIVIYYLNSETIVSYLDYTDFNTIIATWNEIDLGVAPSLVTLSNIETILDDTLAVFVTSSTPYNEDEVYLARAIAGSFVSYLPDYTNYGLDVNDAMSLQYYGVLSYEELLMYGKDWLDTALSKDTTEIFFLINQDCEIQNRDITLINYEITSLKNSYDFQKYNFTTGGTITPVLAKININTYVNYSHTNLYSGNNDNLVGGNLVLTNYGFYRIKVSLLVTEAVNSQIKNKVVCRVTDTISAYYEENHAYYDTVDATTDVYVNFNFVIPFNLGATLEFQFGLEYINGTTDLTVTSGNVTVEKVDRRSL